MSHEYIEIYLPNKGSDSKNSPFTLDSRVTQSVAQVKASELGDNIRDFLSKVTPALASAGENLKEYSIDEFELSLTVNAKGGISLLGVDEAGASAGIKVKLKRK